MTRDVGYKSIWESAMSSIRPLTTLEEVLAQRSKVLAQDALEQERAAEPKHEDAWAKALRLRKPAKGWRVGPDGKWTEG